MSAPAVGLPPPAAAACGPTDGAGQVDRTLSWKRRFSVLLLLLDVLAIAVAGAVAAVAPWSPPVTESGLHDAAFTGAVALLWLAALTLNRCYDTTVVATEKGLRRAAQATWQALAALSLASYLTHYHPSRVYVCTLFASGLLTLHASRVVVRRTVFAARRRGQAQRRVLAVGDLQSVRALAELLASDPDQAYRLVGACVSAGSSRPLRLPDGRSVPVVSSVTQLSEHGRAVGADTVAVVSGRHMDSTTLQRIAYSLEGQGMMLLVAPGLSDVPTTRLHVRPLAGLPLLHLDEPELDGPHKVLKGVFDRSVAAVVVIVILPVLVGLWAAVRFTSPGPAIFKQARVGRDGCLFQVWKFRSMYPDAEARLAELMQFNDHQGPLFKMKNDPRITPVGRFLRKWSVDELPQLINVLKGDMSLVGPRPPLPAEVANYDGHAHRRLLVKPGITGLWQVSGRADLHWEEAVRLDLRYVDGWSLGFDLSILLRTAAAVVRSKGAY